ncbi:MAG TPA: globin [Pseudogracilibacillus sp.]|nr:globin [Pseudogracilibacillus sp.]
MTTQNTIFELIGGQAAVERITTSLYTHIGQNKQLLEIFPEDLNESARKQRLFLTQFFGGPALYAEERGAPMLRRRHLPFEITPERARQWLYCMDLALDEAKIQEPYRTQIFDRLTQVGTHMINS